VKTLRLLVWLRWRIGLNTTTTRGRWAFAGITVLMALAMSPVYVGGAIGSFALGAKLGAQALPIVFGLCQVSVAWVSLLVGAMGRTYELDKLKRYPLEPRDVFAINTLASLGEPIMLMTVPSLVTVSLGIARHSGALAGWAAAGGGLLLLLVTASLLQLVLALIDDLLRREWMRYVAAFFFTMTLIAFQLMVRRSSSNLAEQARKAGYTPERLLDEVRLAFEKLPTVAAPASAAGAHPAGWLHAPLAGLAACLVLVVAPLALGARVMTTAALRPGIGGRVRSRASGAGRGSLGPKLPGLTRPQSLLVARELLYMTRTPALLYQLAVVSLTAVALVVVAPSRNAALGAFMPLFVLVGSLAGRNLMLWGYDGPGIRTLFLLPVSTRTCSSARAAASRPIGPAPMIASEWREVSSGVLGTWVSARFPMRPPERGLGRRSPGGAAGLGALLGVFAIAGALAFAVYVVRSLTPDAYDEAASLAVTSLAACAAAVVWWIGLDRNADVVEQSRERMIDVLAKASDA